MEPTEDAALVVAVDVVANLVDMTDALLLTTRGWLVASMDGFGFRPRFSRSRHHLSDYALFITNLTVHEPQFGRGTRCNARVLCHTGDSETLCMIHFTKVYRV